MTLFDWGNPYVKSYSVVAAALVAARRPKALGRRAGNDPAAAGRLPRACATRFFYTFGGFSVDSRTEPL